MGNDAHWNDADIMDDKARPDSLKVRFLKGTNELNLERSTPTALYNDGRPYTSEAPSGTV
jgi:hypothetical protein